MPSHRITPVDGDLSDLFNKTITYDNQSIMKYIKVDGHVLQVDYERVIDAIENFDVRDDDVWICGFPKMGNTWMQEMVWLIANDLDFEGGKEPVAKRIPNIETCTLLTPMTQSTPSDSAGQEQADYITDSINYIANMPSPRFIGTHLPVYLLPRKIRTAEKKPKMIHITRNPKDTCISYYHFMKLLGRFHGSFHDFCTLFIGGSVVYGPFWKSVLSFWEKRNEYNLLFLKYEDMKRDLPSVIEKTAAFLGKILTADEISLLTEHLSFSSMKKNPATNRERFLETFNGVLPGQTEGKFMRKGTSEQWQTDMPPEIIEQFDNLIHKHFDGTGFSF